MSAARGEARREAVPATTIDRLVDGVYPAMALLAGMELDLFTAIGEGASSSAEIAIAIQTAPAKTQLLLDALVAAGLLEKQHGRFSLTDEASDHLTRSSPWSRAAAHPLLRSLWAAALRTSASVRSGQAEHPPNFACLSAAQAEDLLRGMASDAAASAVRALECIDLHDGDRVVDVGGGAGSAACAFMQAARGVRATVVELPSIAPASRRLVEEAGWRDRVDVVAADAAVEVPGNYDVAWLSFVIQTLGPAAAEAVISNTARALTQNGSMHLVNVVVDASRVNPPQASLFNIALLNLYDAGQAYSMPDYERWLRSAGFADIRWTRINDMIQLVSARRR